jgi:hypothetical protein
MKAHLGTTCLGTIGLAVLLLFVSTWQSTPTWSGILLGSSVLLGGLVLVAVWERRSENNQWKAAADVVGLEAGFSGLEGVFDGRGVKMTFSDLGHDEEVRTIGHVHMTVRPPIANYLSFTVTARKPLEPRKNEHILGNGISIYESNPPDFAARVFDDPILRDMLHMNDSRRKYVSSIQLADSQLRFEPAIVLWPEDVEPTLKVLREVAMRVESFGKTSA